MTTAPDSFTEYLRITHQEAWHAATANRFTRELVADEINDSVYARYLTLDYAFIDGLVSAFGHAVAVAPGMPEKIRFTNFLAMLTSEEKITSCAASRLSGYRPRASTTRSPIRWSTGSMP
jgi:thiaminase/transcriptional activator TenA